MPLSLLSYDSFMMCLLLNSFHFPPISRFLLSFSSSHLRAIIFIDELDSIGTRNNFQGINTSNHATVSQLLTCLDGLTSRENIFVIGATNSLDTIDPALRRSGRFDRAIEMPLPNKASRLDLITFYLQDRPGVQQLIEQGVLEEFSELTKGFSAADLKNFTSEVLLFVPFYHLSFLLHHFTFL